MKSCYLRPFRKYNEEVKLLQLYFKVFLFLELASVVLKLKSLGVQNILKFNYLSVIFSFMIT